MKRTKIDITKIHIIRCKATITPVIKLNKEQLQNWVINGLKNRIIYFFFEPLVENRVLESLC